MCSTASASRAKRQTRCHTAGLGCVTVHRGAHSARSCCWECSVVACSQREVVLTTHHMRMPPRTSVVTTNSGAKLGLVLRYHRKRVFSAARMSALGRSAPPAPSSPSSDAAPDRSTSSGEPTQSLVLTRCSQRRKAGTGALGTPYGRGSLNTCWKGTRRGGGEGGRQRTHGQSGHSTLCTNQPSRLCSHTYSDCELNGLHW